MTPLSKPYQRLPLLMATLAGVALVAAAAWWVPHLAADHLLAEEARASSLDWAEVVLRAVPDLDDALDGHGISDATLQHLREFRGFHEVDRFKVFLPDGRLLLTSTALPAPGQPVPPPSSVIEDDVVSVARLAAPEVDLRHGDGVNTPTVFSETLVPLVQDGRVLGVVEVYVDQQHRANLIRNAFAQVSATVLAALLLLGGLAAWHWHRRNLAQWEAEERVRYLALHDPLCGTLNRVSFHDVLRLQVKLQGKLQDKAATTGQGFAVLCINLDHFKQVNDTQGLEAGDQVLSEVGRRLRALVRHGDQVARLGSDEFAILQTNVADAHDVAQLAQRVVDELARPFVLQAEPLMLGASVGAALWGVDATDVDGLMHKADLALFRAKSDGRATFSFYDAGLDERLQQRRDLTRDLARAITAGEMSLNYQPLFEAGGKTLTGYEALARWHHPVRGPISPAEFIPLAEDAGLIEALGSWVLRTACAEAATWPGHLTVAVNLSAAQFRHGDLVPLVQQALHDTGLSAHRLEVEVTESLLISSPEAVVGMLRALAATGVRIAMDDFGTGYSSLAYLWRFPFHKLKIDRAFTQSIEHDAKVRVIVRAIISLAHALDLRVNAEGVETEGQMQALCLLGCDELQGYLLGRPAPVSALAHTAATTKAPAAVS
ncbi:MAG: GGDEF-domain containing protein [Burkholderiales bacterium PBB6]|nr:MAG: GGDEF-domain containing protein [Burkholderiales bacterium PBB6]